MQCLHTDGEGECQNAKAVKQTQTCASTARQNHFSKRINRTRTDPTMVLLEQAVLAAKYLEAGIEYVAYDRNRLLHSALGCSTFENLTGKKYSPNYIRIFGFAAFVYDEHPKTRFNFTGRSGIMHGRTNHATHTVESMENKQIVESVQVTFDENSFPALETMEFLSSSGQDYRWDNCTSEKSEVSFEGKTSDESETFPSEFNERDSNLKISTPYNSEIITSSLSVENIYSISSYYQPGRPRRSTSKYKKPKFFRILMTRFKHKAKLVCIHNHRR